MKVAAAAASVREQVGKAVVGQERAVDYVLIAFLADGHVLLEGVPGLAKTLLVRTLAYVLGLEFKRIQFTPDLMPSDVIGTNVFDQKRVEFKLRKGPIFTSVLLADEINRTPPKTQAALLEAMEERRVTIDGDTMDLPFPFIVFATQNPIDFEGTYPLPEAQQDRFLLKVLLDYPLPDQEQTLLRRFHAGFRSQTLEDVGLEQVFGVEELKELRRECDAVRIEDKIFSYIYEIVSATRSSNDVLIGASPRAGLALVAGSKALAAMRNRDFVIPDDVKELALPVMRHRVLIRPEVELEGMTVDQVLTKLVDAQVVPR
ncbi:MAG: MoxR family ATPase [Armatimonadetes bacterium]|nr:MoxR family ATPase [Armatimonadota bacterium]